MDPSSANRVRASPLLLNLVLALNSPAIESNISSPGNYELVLKAINDWNFSIIVPFMLGCVIGLITLSHIISWVLRRFRNVTLSLITGFIIGSLLLIWPWKDDVLLKDDAGNYSVKVEEGIFEYRSGGLEKIRGSLREGEEFVVIGYSNWHFPSLLDLSSIVAIIFALPCEKKPAQPIEPTNVITIPTS